VVEHYLHTVIEKSCSTGEKRPNAENKPPRPDLGPDLLPSKRRRKRRFARIGKGLYRYLRTGQIYFCQKRSGKNVWKKLNTTDKNQAVALAGVSGLARVQNGNHSVVIISVGDTGPVQFTPPAEEWQPPIPAAFEGNQAVSASPTAAPSKHVTLQSLATDLKAQWTHLSASTQKLRGCYVTTLEKHLDFSSDVTHVTAADVRKLRGELAQGRKASTVNDLLSKGLRPLFDLALESGAIAKSPMDGVKLLKKTKPIRLQPSWQEALAILEKVEASAPKSAPLLRFILYFGVGQAEVQGVKGEHFDFGRGELHLFRQKTRKEYVVPIYPHCKLFVQQLKDESRIVAGNKVFNWRSPRKALETACVALGLPKFSPRALRRTFIVHCLEKGMDARVVADLQGHADATLILRVYGKFISPDHRKRQVEKLET